MTGEMAKHLLKRGFAASLLPGQARVRNIVFRQPILLCGALYILLRFDASGFLRISLLAACLHECGHILVFVLLKKRLPVIEVSMTGFCMQTRGCKLTPGQRLILAAAGPAVNLLLALAWLLRTARQASVFGQAFLAANLLTGLFNLLPVPPLDGAQILGSAASILKGRSSLKNK